MRLILRLVGAILVLAILAVVGVLMIPAERVADAAARQFSQLTGRQLQIDGSVRPSFWPDLGVRTGPVTIANAPWSDQGPMLQAEGLQISVNLAGLFGGEVRITGLEAIKPVLVLERSAEGQENWVFGGAGGGTVTPDTPGVDAPFTFDRLEIRDGSLRFLDHRAGQSWSVEALDLTATSPAWMGPLDLKATGRMNGQAVSLTATAGVFSDVIAGRVVPLTLVAGAGDATVSFDGRAGLQPLQGEGRLDAKLGNLQAVSAVLGAAAPSLPTGLGAKDVALSGAVTLAPDGKGYLREAAILLDDNRFEGAADLSLDGPRPKLTARLTGGDLAFADGAFQGGGSDGGGAAPGWSTTPIDVSGLSAMDADISLDLASLATSAATLGKTSLRMTLDRARAVFDIAGIQAYDGNIRGQFVINGRGGLSVGGNLTFAGLAMQPLLSQGAGYDRLSGTGDLAVKFLAVGNSMAELMQSLSGDGSLAFSQGEMRGLDILGMLRSLDAGYVGEGQKTIFDAITASFTIADGVLSNSDLTMAGPDLTATGDGRIGIGARNLDYRLRPTALVGADGSGGVRVPLLITGSWEDPKFRLDLESMARERMEEEAKALEAEAKARAKELEDEAKAELEQKLRDELGVEAQEGESIEDATRRRAQEAIDAEADRLLQDLLGNPEAPVAGE